MLVKVSQSDFYSSLQTAQRGTASQSTLPILTGIKIETDEKDSLTLQSTDLEISMKVICGANIEKKGAFVVAGKLLLDVFKFIPDGTVSLSLEKEGKQLHVSSGRSSFKIQTMSTEDFPAFPEAQEEQLVEIETQELLETIKQTSKAISRDETRPVLTGAFLKIEKTKLLVVATDSYRLAHKSVDIKNPRKATIEVLVPYRAIEEISKIITGTERVSLSTDNNLLKARTDRGVVFTRLIEGQFPNYEQLIPKASKQEVTAKKEDLIGAINQAALMAQKNMSIKISVSEEMLSISAATAGIGEAAASIGATTSGETVGEMAFNAQYLIDGLSVMPGEEVLLEFNGATNPGLIKPVDDKSYLYLVMPIRIN